MSGSNHENRSLSPVGPGRQLHPRIDRSTPAQASCRHERPLPSAAAVASDSELPLASLDWGGEKQSFSPMGGGGQSRATTGLRIFDLAAQM